MKQVTWTDEKGYNHCSMIRDNDPDTMAQKGIPCDPPSVNDIDWEAVKRDLHNLLLGRGIIKRADLQTSTNNIRSVLQDALYVRLVALFTE